MIAILAAFACARTWNMKRRRRRARVTRGMRAYHARPPEGVLERKERGKDSCSWRKRDWSRMMGWGPQDPEREERSRVPEEIRPCVVSRKKVVGASETAAEVVDSMMSEGEGGVLIVEEAIVAAGTVEVLLFRTVDHDRTGRREATRAREVDRRGEGKGEEAKLRWWATKARGEEGGETRARNLFLWSCLEC